ncbi:thiamine phosphate synthase [Flavivirga eckloniae]|uniref:Thiamine phosphate synthase n=1 Tax=Flavivirga eckloniae TaxID=1803846 RepID=A0A2K9PKG5_9FLAO|nr:thiamine phosphate synthase [Flavivirga eckloniae]AUP77544.1 thiamine phosphate synthase [Flavivirga eckloniae]
MIVVIAPEEDIRDEIIILNQLFEAGLEYYHLRKPMKNFKEHGDYIQQINTRFHNRIVVHYHHELIDEFDLKGIHFQEQKRRDTSSRTIDTFLKNKQISVSSSFHDPKELSECTYEFNYQFLSPVFTSISKENYKGQGFDVNDIPKRIIGMGGATKDNINDFIRLGFQGVGVLGGIWNSKTPVDDLKQMLNYFN